MGITTVTATAHEVLSAVTGWDRTHVLPVIRATVETDEGVTGHGLVHGVFGLEAICTQINHALAAENEGLNPLETD